jgi:hypothetical protein
LGGSSVRLKSNQSCLPRFESTTDSSSVRLKSNQIKVVFLGAWSNSNQIKSNQIDKFKIHPFKNLSLSTSIFKKKKKLQNYKVKDKSSEAVSRSLSIGGSEVKG